MSAVAIIVRAKNGHALTEACLNSIRENTPDGSYVTILSDDGSEPAYAPDAADYVVRSAKSNGAVTATNLAISLTFALPCRYVAILDNDTEVPAGDRGWLARWVIEIEQYPGTAVVGATTNYANPPQHILASPHTYMAAWKDEQTGRSGIKDNPAIHSFVSCCALFQKAALAQVGLWDERYNPGQYEDTDYAMALRAAGFELRVARSVYIHHQGHKTFSDQLQRLLSENGQKFADKWGVGRLMDMGFVSPDQVAAMLAAQRGATE